MKLTDVTDVSYRLCAREFERAGNEKVDDVSVDALQSAAMDAVRVGFGFVR